MKILSTLIVAVTLAATLSPALAEPRNPDAALVPIDQAMARTAFVEGRQSVAIDQGRPAGVVLSGAEHSVIDRNLPHR